MHRECFTLSTSVDIDCAIPSQEEVGYRVSWQGYNSNYNEWIPHSEVDDPCLIAEYETKKEDIERKE